MPSNNIKFDVDNFLANIGEGRTIVPVRKKERVYAQGDACDAIFYVVDLFEELGDRGTGLSQVAIFIAQNFLVRCEDRLANRHRN